MDNSLSIRNPTKNISNQRTMNTKWKVITSVMLIILVFCTSFTIFFISHTQDDLETYINLHVTSIRGIASTLQEQTSNAYRKRINSFLNHHTSPERSDILKAFADQDRAKLLRLTSPFLDLFKKENPHFTTFSWISPDNKAFLLVHNPTKFGFDVSKMRPDVVWVNKEHQQSAGFNATPVGLQYSVVSPVTFKDEHIGALQFGLQDSFLIDAIYDKLDIPVGLLIPEENYQYIKHSKLPGIAGPSFSIQSHQIDLFKNDFDTIDWTLDKQRITLQGKNHVIIKVMKLNNSAHEPQGHIFVALDISKLVSKVRSHIILIISLSCLLMVLSFLILYFTYGSMAQKIINLQVVEKVNRELEARVTERTRELEENKNHLMQSEEKFRRIVENISDVYYETGLDGIIHYCSPSCLEFSGYSQVELIGKNAIILYNDPADRKLLLAVMQKEGKARNVELVFKKKNGELYDVSFNADFSLDESGQPTRLSGTIRDITRAKKVKKQIHRSKKMEAIGLMAGGVAHDLNNILSGIVGYPELLLQTLPKDSDLRKPIEAIRESGQRAATVVTDLLTVARGAASIREVHDLNSLIEEYIISPECKKIRSLHPHITFMHHLNAKHSAISCSPVHVKKCLMNLVINAAEAMPDDGTITLSTHNQSIDNTTAIEQKMKTGDYVVISVRDTGPGISDTDLEHIFEPFYTKKTMGRSGTGLGLAVVWNTMEDHEGKVLVESSDQGTCFLLYFPVSEEENNIQPDTNKAAKLTGNSEHILIVDDEAQLRDIASQMLQTLGYTVDTVCSGEEAIQFVKETPVDLIVMDMLMEPGMDGRQTYEEITMLFPGQKAIIASGFSESDNVKATLQLGADGFIRKPYSMKQLGQAVKKALRS
jgi:PAS domain S-box-containing protein